MSSRSARSMVARVFLGAALVAAAAVLAGGGEAGEIVARLGSLVRRLGWAAAPVYASAYVAASVLMMPVSPLTAVAGHLFGWGAGAAIGALASIAGAVSSLLVGRTLGRPAAARLARDMPRFEAISRAVERRGFEVIALLRISPLVPFPLLNYALGLTRLSAGKFALASLVGMFPGNVLYAYLGSRAQRIAQSLQQPRLAPAQGIAAGAAVVALSVLLVGWAGLRLAKEMRTAEGGADSAAPPASGTSRGPRP